MCEPVSLGLGLLSAGSSGLSAYAGHKQAQDQAAAQNRSIANQANQRNRKYELDNLQGIAEYNTAKTDVKRQQNEVGLQFSRSASEEQLREDDEINQYILQDQTLVAQLLKDAPVNEGGRARTRGRNLQLTVGRQRGSNFANLARGRIASKIRLDDARRQANSKRQSLFAGVASPFRAGPAPNQNVEFVKGPSKLGLVAGLAGAAVDGASTYNNFAPESQRIGGIG